MASTYRRPEAPVSATWPSDPAYKDATGKPADKMVADIPWQEFFVDPQLQQLIGLALGLPFTHRMCTAKLAAPQGEPFTHEP